MTEFTNEHFLNREISWLEFNQRVLEEAIDTGNPLLERVKFFSIVSSNLDEFFEVRVAGLKQQIEGDIVERSMDGRTALETVRMLTKRARRMVEDQYRLWRSDLQPGLEKAGIRFLEYEELDEKDRAWLEGYYRSQVRPVLTPLAVDPAHPFPHIQNKALNLVVSLSLDQDNGVPRLAVMQVPRVLPRIVQVPRENNALDFIFLGHIIGHYLADLFPGTVIHGHWKFRVTRNSELYVDEDDAENMLQAVEEELRNRRKGEAVRLEVDADCPQSVWQPLLETHNLTEDDLYLINGPINPTRLMAVYEVASAPELRDKPFVAPLGHSVRERSSLFPTIRRRDVLVHHPYESFSTVVDFLEQAARDPNVLAIKQTLYRTGGDQRIVGALMLAAENGKQVTAIAELKARFDEANNIQWARRLEENGVHVVYGLVGKKVHGKITLVVRRDEDGLRRYVHIGTGNYNPTTARLYTDLSFFTCKEDIAEDATNLFNLLTGFCRFQKPQKLLVAPFELQPRLIDLIAKEADHAQKKRPARIIAKMNSLSDLETIRALYRASQAGVKIDLIVRGICCLRPGVPGVSENITVRSIVGRFLEHARIFHFENGGKPITLIGSADWMSRNFQRRMEVVTPIEDVNLRERIVTRILGAQLADNTKAWQLEPDGSYTRVVPRSGEAKHDAQAEFMADALDRAKTSRKVVGMQRPKTGTRTKKAESAKS